MRTLEVRLCAPPLHPHRELTFSGTGKCHKRATTIDMLVDDILLETFDFCRKMHYIWDPFPPHHIWDWHILVHVCRRWRKIIFDSPCRLNLRILCTYGTRVRKNLGIWPAFPINLQLYSRAKLRPKDEDNAIAALEHRNRVNSVRLFGTGSQITKVAAAMQEPFPVLTYLNLCSCCEDTSVIPAGFLGGSAPHLQEITLCRIPFPSLPTLLLSTSDLNTLNLLDIPTLGYISHKRMVACLAALPRLEVFNIRFPDLGSRPRRIRQPPATRSVLPALTTFSFQGAFEYLEDFVAQVDTPQLEEISLHYLDQPDDFQVTQVSHFIDRTIGPGSSRHANVQFQFDQVTFALSRDYEIDQGWARRCIATTISYEAFDWPELSDVARVLSRFSAALCTVVYLELKAELDNDLSDRAYDVDWLDLLRQCPAIQTLHVYRELAAPVSLSLQVITTEMFTGVFPSLGLIYLEGEPASSLEKTVAILRFSEHPITVVETPDEFTKRLESFVSR